MHCVAIARNAVFAIGLVVLGASMPANAASCSSCFADLNGDQMVNGADLGILLAAWGTDDLAADLNNDGNVDGADLGLMLGAWGPSPCKPSNDTCANAIALVGFSGSVNDFCTVNATSSGPDVVECGNSPSDQIANDIWYRFTPNSDGVAQVSICGDFDTRLAVYGENIFGNCGCPSLPFPAPLLACNDDAYLFNNCSILFVEVEAGDCYTIRVGGAPGQQGSGTLDINLLPIVCEAAGQQVAPVTGMEDFAEFGINVDIDGDVAVVGAVQDDLLIGGENAGSARVYRRKRGAWALEQALFSPTPFEDQRFGVDVAVSGDWIAVSAPEVDPACAADFDCLTGIVYIFHFDGASWVFDQSVTHTGTNNGDRYGVRCALHGNRLIVGAPDDDIVEDYAGSAYIYEYTTLFGGVWFLSDKISPADGTLGAGFGWAVDIQDTTAVIGADNADSPGASNSGAAYIYNKVGVDWTQTAKLVANDLIQSDWFGTAVAIDGDRAVIGAPHFCCTGETPGRADVFNRSSGVWKYETTLTAFDGVNEDFFGDAVDIDGDVITVSALGRDVGGPNIGAIYVFKFTPGGWMQRAILTAPDPLPEDRLRKVAISGQHVVGAAPTADTRQGEDAGEVYFFDGIIDENLNFVLDLCEP